MFSRARLDAPIKMKLKLSLKKIRANQNDARKKKRTE
jgi:hypothetical protein